MTFHQIKTKARLELLIVVASCVAAVVVTEMLRGRGKGAPALATVSQAPQKLDGFGRAAGRIDGTKRPPVSNAILTKLAAGIGKLYSHARPEELESVLQNTVADIPVADIPDILKALAVSTPHPVNSELRLALVTRWTELEPKAAAAWVTENLDDTLRQQALNAVGVAWCATDAGAAMMWAKGLQTVEERNGVIAVLAYEVSREDPTTASVLLAELPSEKINNDLVSRIATLWGEKFSPQVLDWSAKLPTMALREQAVAAVAMAWAGNDPASAGKLAVETLAGKAQEDAVLAVVQRWTQQDPVRAAEWVANFPEGEVRTTAVEELVKLWTFQDADAAGRWLNEIRPGPTRDIAIGAYAAAIAPNSPQLAAQWANDIGDDNLRFDEIERIAELWLSDDANAARHWLARASLPPERKARLLAAKLE